jgi:hypothetical protein
MWSYCEYGPIIAMMHTFDMMLYRPAASELFAPRVVRFIEVIRKVIFAAGWFVRIVDSAPVGE